MATDDSAKPQLRFARRVPNLFISWSGDRSEAAAKALCEWVPILIQSAAPWISSGIGKGSRWLDELATQLQATTISILCLTPENMNSPWLLFEAGALSKTVDYRTRACTYLLCGLEPEQVAPPLGIFQATRSNKDDTRRLVHTLNYALSDPPVPDAHLDILFDLMWPKLDKSLLSLPDATVAAPERSLQEMWRRSWHGYDQNPIVERRSHAYRSM